MNKQNSFLTLLVMLLTFFVVSSCSKDDDTPIDNNKPTYGDNDDDDEAEEGSATTTYNVAFRYTDPHGIDVFSSQVTSISLFVYDKEGNLVTALTESGETLKRENYTMSINIAQGIYDLVAWCGLEDGNSFIINDGKIPTILSDANCRLIRETAPDGSATSSKSLQPLYHAMLSDVEFSTLSETPVTMHLVKDTNTISVALTNLFGKQVNPEDFTITIHDNNGYLAYDNHLLDDAMITYKPWMQSLDNNSSLVAYFDLSRLTADHDTRLTIHATGKDAPILSVSLTQLLVYIKDATNSQMPYQQYLDNNDKFEFTFFIDDNNEWNKNAGIYINGWRFSFPSSDEL